MKVSFIFPIYNEVNTVEEIVETLKNVPLHGLQKEIILIDDYSTDGTRELLKTKMISKVDKILYHEKNKGKGASLHTGIAVATGDYIAIQDADLEYNPYDYEAMLKPILDGRADVVYGSRYLFSQERRVLFYWHSIANGMLTTISNMLTNLHLTDVHACYKIFPTEVLRSLGLKEKRFAFDPEVTARLSKRKLRIYEVGISYAHRTYAEGKKIGMRDAFRAVWVMVKYRFFD
jgi:glycosyltransferase involved in cell wall biosynthesis